MQLSVTRLTYTGNPSRTYTLLTLSFEVRLEQRLVPRYTPHAATQSLQQKRIVPRFTLQLILDKGWGKGQGTMEERVKVFQSQLGSIIRQLLVYLGRKSEARGIFCFLLECFTKRRVKLIQTNMVRSWGTKRYGGGRGERSEVRYGEVGYRGGVLTLVLVVEWSGLLYHSLTACLCLLWKSRGDRRVMLLLLLSTVTSTRRFF